ncbi:MAG: hypothetical protein AAFY27_05120, partial [Pseudomonadota bacterium]
MSSVAARASPRTERTRRNSGSSLGIPFVQFDLNQARRLVGDAALYAENNCPKALARETLRLVDDPELRRVL